MPDDKHREPFRVTADSVDPAYNSPVVETDELRDAPVSHRYVNGRFDGTGAQFSFYFPPTGLYQGRFFRNTYPMALTEDIGPFPIAFDVATGDLGFTFDSGAYYVQTNLGGADRMPPADPAIAAYRVNAAAAKYSRALAVQLYGGDRPFGYLYGGSGGSYQVVGAALNTTGVWDGFLPYVMGTPNSIPSMFTVRMHALRVLRRRGSLPAIMDACPRAVEGKMRAGGAIPICASRARTATLPMRIPGRASGRGEGCVQVPGCAARTCRAEDGVGAAQRQRLAGGGAACTPRGHGEVQRDLTGLVAA
jgi:hypothetical protein